MSSVELIAPSTEFCRWSYQFRRNGRHVESHRPTPQQCNVVNVDRQTFGTSKRLEWHRKSVHSTVVKCLCCGKTFKSKTAMTYDNAPKRERVLENTEFQNPRSYERHGEILLECDFTTKNI